MTKMGRPKKEINKEEFEKLCALQCTQVEICSWFDVTDKTLESWCKREYKQSFSEVFSKKRGKGKVSLRRTQFRLADYEDLEEQGKLLKLPCEFGDTVYVKMQFGDIAEAEVKDFSYFLSCGFCIVVTSDKFDKQSIPFSEFSKSVFLTREEAETALKE